jgi:hypothetical protein
VSPAAKRAAAGWPLALVQLAVAAGVWDLARIGRLDATHATLALLAVAVPGVAALVVRRRQ